MLAVYDRSTEGERQVGKTNDFTKTSFLAPAASFFAQSGYPLAQIRS
jgi:hypothetical protein